jgi:hypothetical protein
MDDDRVAVGLIDRADIVVTVSRLHVCVGIHDRVPREHDIVGRKRGAVLPQDAAPKMVGDRKAVLRDRAVGERRYRGRELRNQLIVVVVIEQIARPEHRDVDVDAVLADQRAQVVGIRESS